MVANRQGRETDRLTVPGPTAPWRRDDMSAELAGIGHLAGFVLRSLGRRPYLVLVSSALCIALGIFVLSLVPKTFRVPSRILTHPGAMLPNLSNPTRRIPSAAEDGTR